MAVDPQPTFPSSSQTPPSRSSLASRRKFLSLLAGGTAAAGAGGWLLTSGGNEAALAAPSTSPVTGTSVIAAGEAVAPAVQTLTPSCPGARRNLIVLELSGGNDGLATVVPYGDGRLNDLRPSIGFDPEELVIIDDHTGLTPALAPLWAQGLAMVQGVGTPTPNGSHFEMERRWWAGDPDGNANLGTGFLGRLCDELHAGDPITGLTVGTSASPIMYGNRAGTVALTEPDMTWFLYNDDPWFKNLRSGLADLSRGSDARMAPARDGLASALNFADVLSAFQVEDEEDSNRPEYPGNGLSDQFRMAADVLGADVGVRVVHVPFGGFDTHEDQRGSHEYLWEQISESLVAFRQDLERLGLADDTLIATVSEFGRRPDQNGSGTDHGAASMAMLCGPVVNGLHGEAPSLRKLNDDDNLAATVRMDEYYATIAHWMGVDPQTVLPTNASIIENLMLPCSA